MATDYQLVILDDMDWSYVGYGAAHFMAIWRAFPAVEAVHHPCWGMIVVEIRGGYSGEIEQARDAGGVWDALFVREATGADLVRVT